METSRWPSTITPRQGDKPLIAITASSKLKQSLMWVYINYISSARLGVYNRINIASSYNVNYLVEFGLTTMVIILADFTKRTWSLVHTYPQVN